MAVPVSAIIGIMERVAPRRLALGSDRERIGLVIGSPESMVERVMVALDVTPEVLQEAMAAGAGMLVVHHPPLYRPLTALRTDTPAGRMVAMAVAHGLAVFAAHTNLDVVEGGVASVLASRLGVAATEVLEMTARERLFKLVVFVPASHADELRLALGEAGAGHLGRYSHCTFSAPGTGTFLPLEGAKPYLGEQGSLARVEEVRVETIVPEERLEASLRAMRRVHPYEEIAYDIYPLENQGGAVGLGRIGRLAEERTLREFVGAVKEALGVPQISFIGPPEQRVVKVAVCGGSAGELVAVAAQRGADVLVAGEIKYHDGLLAKELGLAVVAAGHDATERVVLPVLAERLRRESERLALRVEVLVAQSAGTLWQAG